MTTADVDGYNDDYGDFAVNGWCGGVTRIIIRMMVIILMDVFILTVVSDLRGTPSSF